LSALAPKLCDLPFATVDTVFQEMVWKLAHIRVQEYLDTKRSTTLAGQTCVIYDIPFKINSSINVI